MNDANPEVLATLQSAHRVLAMTEHECFEPLVTIQQNYLRELQGGGGVTTRSGLNTDPRAQTNADKVKKLVKKIHKLYSRLRAEVRKRFPSNADRKRALNLVHTLSTRLGNMVAFFARQLGRIRRLPGAVMEAVQKLPFVTRRAERSRSAAEPRRSPRARREPVRFVPS